MPTSPHIQREILDELAAGLTAHTWPGNIPAIVAERRRKADFTTNDIGTMKVSVVGGPFSMKPNTRSDDMFDVMVGIVIAKLVASEQEIDDLEDLGQAIVDAIRSDSLTMTLPAGTDWSEIEVPVVCDPDQLEERSVFMSQIVVTYQVPRSKIVAE